MDSHHLIICKISLEAACSLTSRLKAVNLQKTMGVKGPVPPEMMETCGKELGPISECQA